MSDLNLDMHQDSLEVIKSDSLLRKSSVLHPELIYWRIKQIRKEITEEEFQEFYKYYAILRNRWIKTEIININQSNYEKKIKNAVVKQLKERFVFGLKDFEIDSMQIKSSQKQIDYVVYKFYQSDRSQRFSPQNNYRFLREKKEAEVFSKLLKTLNVKATTLVFPKKNYSYILDHFYVLEKPEYQGKFFPVHKWLAEIFILITDEIIEEEIVTKAPPFNPVGKILSIFAGASLGTRMNIGQYSKLGSVAPQIQVTDTNTVLKSYFAGIDYYYWRKMNFEIFQYFSISSYLKYLPGQDYDSRKDINTDYYQLADPKDPDAVDIIYNVHDTKIHFDPIYILGVNFETPLYFFSPSISTGISAGYEAQFIHGKEIIYIREYVRYNQNSFHYVTIGGSYDISEINHIISGALNLRLNYGRILAKVSFGWPYSNAIIGFIL